MAVELCSGLALLAFLAFSTSAHLGRFPTGNDPANWIVDAQDVKAWLALETGPVARPLVPALVGLLNTVVDPLESARLVGITSLLAVAGGVYLAARRCAPFPLALLAAVVAGASRAVNETVAFGGYPQNFGLAGITLALAFLPSVLPNPDRTGSMLLVVGLVVAATSHHLYFGLGTVIYALTFIALWPQGTAPGIRAGLAALGAGFVAATPTLYVFVREGYAPSGLQSAISVKASFDYMFGEQRLLYIPMFSLSLLYSSLVLLGPRVRPRAVPFAVALAVLLPMFGWSAEPRLLPFMLVAATVTAAAAIYELLSRSSFRPAARFATYAILTLAVLSFTQSSSQTNSNVYGFYRVYDEDLGRVLEYVAERDEQGTVAVAAGHDGWPLGWWAEATSDGPVLTGANAIWLGFPAERTEAAVVGALTDPGTPPTEVRAIVAEHDISLVVADRRFWSGYSAWASGTGRSFDIVLMRGPYVVLSAPAGD